MGANSYGSLNALISSLLIAAAVYFAVATPVDVEDVTGAGPSPTRPNH